MPQPSIEALVRELADREAIRTLTSRYCQYVWEHNPDGIVALYADDGHFQYVPRTPGTPRDVRGRAALTEYYHRVSTLETYPYIHNHVIDLAGDRATGTCHVDVRGRREGHLTMQGGFYRDTYVRVGADWKFQSRRLEAVLLVPLEH